jgi:CheY-like chemotaxis protein
MTKPRLLLLDDDPDLGLVLRSLTRRAGHDLTHHLDAESAWAGLAAADPDLILLDVNLPGASGLEFLRRLRASPDHARRAVALFAQPSLTRDIAAGWAAGADYHLSKDLVTRPDAWRERLDEILAHLRGRASGESLFIDRGRLAAAGLDSPGVPMAFPMLDRRHDDLLRAMTGRAGGTEPSTPEAVCEYRLRMIDQLGCLFGRAACEKVLKEDRRGSDDEKPPER